MAAIMITRLDRYLLVAILRGVGLVAAVLLTLRFHWLTKRPLP